MGLKKFIEKKLAGSPQQKYQKQRRQADQLAFKQKIYEAEKKGYETSALKAAEARGAVRGRGGNGFSAKVGGNLSALGSSINQTEKAFGFGSIVPTASNIDVFSNPMGFGMASAEKKQIPQRITKISKSGVVTIIEPAIPKNAATKKQKQSSPYNWMNDIDSNLLG
jgi:hypothetical protein